MLTSALGFIACGAMAAEKPAPKFRTPPPPPILDSFSGSNNGAPTGTGGLTNIPAGGYQNEPIGIRQSSLFRNSQFPTGNPIAIPDIEASARTESVKARAIFDLPTVNAGIPLVEQGFEPQDADLKIGPVYFKLRSLEGAVLRSDNINLTPPDQQESGTIAIVSLNLSVVAQLTEGLRLAVSGALVYLPLEGKAGIAGFAFGDLYSLGIFSGPVTRAQIAWETQIGGWNVVFTDEFSIRFGTYSNDLRNNTNYFNEGRFNEDSRAGHYVFAPPQVNADNGDDNNNDRDDLVVFSNLISADIDRLTPGSIRLRARIYHEDLWYNQGNRGLPRLREGAIIRVSSERQNMRFKPFASYEAYRTDRSDSFQNIFRLGIDGPITDQIQLHAEAGYYFGGDRSSGSLWNITLNHIAGPYTVHSLTYTRSFTSFHDEIQQGFGYMLRQVLGPKLVADVYFYDLDIQDSGTEDIDEDSRHEVRAGVRFTLQAGPKTDIRISGNYGQIEPDETEVWTGRLEIGYNFTDTLLARLIYQYQDSTSGRIEDDNYRENMVFFSLTKFFQ